MIYKEIDALIAKATKEQNTDLMRVYRSIKNEFQKAEKNKIVIDEATEVKILLAMATQRKDSISQFIEGNRPELADAEKKELEIIEGFIPAQPTDEDIENYTRTTLTAYKLSKEDGYKLSMKDMKPIMTLVQEKYPTANGGIISKVLKSCL